MSEEVVHIEGHVPLVKIRRKRDIFRFTGERPTAINLEHVTNICIEGKRLTFSFYSTALNIDLESEEAAKIAFEQLLNIWASDVLA